jgi:hypothetical protein
VSAGFQYNIYNKRGEKKEGRVQSQEKVHHGLNTSSN